MTIAWLVSLISHFRYHNGLIPDFLLQFLVDSFLVLGLLLVLLDIFSLYDKLLFESIGTFSSDFSHLAFFQSSFKLLHSIFEVMIFLLQDYTLLIGGEELSLYVIELVSQVFQLSLLLFVGAH